MVSKIRLKYFASSSCFTFVEKKTIKDMDKTVHTLLQYFNRLRPGHIDPVALGQFRISYCDNGLTKKKAFKILNELVSIDSISANKVHLTLLEDSGSNDETLWVKHITENLECIQEPYPYTIEQETQTLVVSIPK